MSRSKSQTQNGSAKKADPPVWSRRIWTGSGSVEAAVFEKMISSDNGDFVTYNVSCKRTYKDGDEYKSTQGFRADDLPVVIQILTQAYSFITDQMNKE